MLSKSEYFLANPVGNNSSFQMSVLMILALGSLTDHVNTVLHKPTFRKSQINKHCQTNLREDTQLTSITTKIEPIQNCYLTG